jgi:hypothetical protein
MIIIIESCLTRMVFDMDCKLFLSTVHAESNGTSCEYL